MNKSIYLCILAAACGGEALDVGSTQSGTGELEGSGGTGGNSASRPLPEWPAPDGCSASSDADIVGVWEGSIQDASFKDVTPLRLEILGASEQGGVCGTLRWSEGELPPAPRNPDVGWPDDARLGFGGGAAFFQEGASYTLLDGVMRGSAVRFRISAHEPWGAWCALQTPYYAPGSDSYQCMPDYLSLSQSSSARTCVLTRPDGSPLQIEVGKCGLCTSPVCSCNASECAANPNDSSASSLSFDLSISGERASGRFLGGGYDNIVLHRL
jgi:hypothetical protein